jgi:arginine decarboxylase
MLNLKLSEGAVVREPADRWTVMDASELYDVESWGKGYFSVGQNGNLLVHPTKDGSRAIDLKELVDTLVLRGISLPILVRFAEILKHRLGEVHDAFESAIAEHGYQGGYCCVYPIKVNQQRQVVEEVFEFGRPSASASRPVPSPNCWPCWLSRITILRSFATVSRTTSTSRCACWPRKSAAKSSR